MQHKRKAAGNRKEEDGVMQTQKKIFYTFMLVIVIPTILFFSLILKISTRLVEKRTVSASELVVKESVKRIDTLLNNYNRISMQIYYNQNIIDYLDKISRKEVDIKNKPTIIAEILDSMVNSDKYLMTAALKAQDFLIMRGTKFYNIEDYFNTNRDKYTGIPGRAFWLTSRRMKTGLGDETFYFGMMRLIRKDNNTIGELVFLLRQEFFDDVYAGSLPDNSGNDYILSQDGMIISASDKNKIGLKINDLNFNSVLTGEMGEYGYIPIKNKSYVIFARSKESGWYFIRELEAKSISDTIAQLRISFIILIACFCSFLILLLYFFSKGISRPINTLAECIHKIGPKNLDIPAPPSENYAPDEIVKLHKYLYEMSLRIEQLIDEVAKTERLKTEAELKALRNHISPHFIYNTLDTIKWMAIINKQENIQKMVCAMDKLMRYASDYKKNLITLDEEIDLTREYLLIQQMRYSDINLIISIPKKMKEFLINKFILQTIVENSIIHGFKNYKNTGTIIIKASVQNAVLTITVSDNGRGFDIDGLRNEDRPHTGLYSVEQRLKLNYGDEFGINVCSRPGKGTAVTVKLPVLE